MQSSHRSSEGEDSKNSSGKCQILNKYQSLSSFGNETEYMKEKTNTTGKVEQR